MPSKPGEKKIMQDLREGRDAHRHCWHHALCPLLPKLLLVVVQFVDAGLRRVRVELERVPSDLELLLSLKHDNSCIQLST